MYDAAIAKFALGLQTKIII